MIYRSLWSVLALACLSACSNSAALDSDTAAEVRAYFASESASSHLTIASTWQADAIETSTVCGTMKPDEDGAKLRFVYDPERKYGQLSLPTGTMGDSAATKKLIEQNRAIFNELWSAHCAPFAPTI